MRFVRGLLVSAAIIVCAPSVVAAQSLVWDASLDSSVVGYRLYWGTQAGIYTSQVDVGNQTFYQPPSGFDWSPTLYFAVLAYNGSGGISSFSNEVQWVPAATPKLTSVRANVSYPLLAGRSVTWTATSVATANPIEYRFWLYRKTGWTLARDYGPGNTFTWTPTQADVGEPYGVQAWARTVGSTAQYESWLGTEAFAVTVLPFELSADVDFPTPPGNQVTWTAKVAAAATSTLEYKFLVQEQGSTTWTMFRDYATSNVAQWTPTMVGTYMIQGWARRVGSTAQYEYIGTTDAFPVSQTPLTVTGLSTDVSFPATTGTAIKWTARVMGGTSGPIQYQFWLNTPTAGWTMVQPYGASQTFTWTPTWGSEGNYAVEVRVRSNGSNASYESTRTSGTFTIERAPITLTTDTVFPVPPGSIVDWRADVPDRTVNFEYQFWLYSAATAKWTLVKPYGVDPTFRWIPATTGNYFIQAWARQVGSSVQYEVYRSTNQLVVSQGPAQVLTLTSNVTLPATFGTTITWSATASGGTAAPLQYQFWRWSSTGWVMAQDYSSVNSYSWTPTATDVGDHAIQVWVRSAGSSAGYESYKSTGIFSIK
jgi:hypothetical protein